jgi:hypothetical protein
MGCLVGPRREVRSVGRSGRALGNNHLWKIPYEKFRKLRMCTVFIVGLIARCRIVESNEHTRWRVNDAHGCTAC